MLTKPCQYLSGVGAKLAEKLAKLHIHTVQDLLFHLPFRYQDRTRVTPLKYLNVGTWAVIEGTIIHKQVKINARPSVICTLQDDTGRIHLRFFNATHYFDRQLAEGLSVRCFGEVRLVNLSLEMVHPELTIISDQPPEIPEYLTPIYATTTGISQMKMRQLTSAALEILNDSTLAVELFPQALLNQYGFINLTEALHFLHHPPPDVACDILEQGLHPAQRRLAFEELLAHHLSMRRLHQHYTDLHAPAITPQLELQQRFMTFLPFQLTAAQQRVIAEITQDLARASPMRRLVQGDVGSGKTIVAAIATLLVASQGLQVAIMAPTELLAEQHYHNFVTWLAPFNISVTCLVAKHGMPLRRTILAGIKQQQYHVIIGTHALFQQQVNFANLGLIIIDEQHRFGVAQRLSLAAKGQQQQLWPHQLIMTATPIPRTLAMTYYADLDISIIDELPAGRTPIHTAIISNSKREEIIHRLIAAFNDQKQAYWVCTLIEESESLQAQTAQETAALLASSLPQFKVGLIHGRLKAQDKELIMQQFNAGTIDLLVATTVIEVGVDVPNASLMVIENSERLGLFQLHQLRGRVGRGSQQSYCLLLYQTPLSHSARERLQIMRDTNDGFVIARKDLELRGFGEILGTRQSGDISFKVADFTRDQDLLNQIAETANLLLTNHPHTIEPLIQRWLGNKPQYVQS